MILSMVVIIVDGDRRSGIEIRSKSKETPCYYAPPEDIPCSTLKEAAAWYNTEVFVSVIILFVCLLALLAILTNWILFTAMVSKYPLSNVSEKKWALATEHWQRH